MKALMIDDDPTMTDLVGLMLSTNGLDVITSNNGEKGIQLVIQEQPDIIILDLMMPGKDGWDVCKALRTFTTTPIIILSALNDPDIISAALDGGADDYIVKPISGGVLMARINMLTRRHRAEIKGTKIAVDAPLAEIYAIAQKPLQASPPGVQ